MTHCRPHVRSTATRFCPRPAPSTAGHGPASLIGRGHFPIGRNRRSPTTALRRPTRLRRWRFPTGQSIALGNIGNFSTAAAQSGLSMKFILGNEFAFRLATISFTSVPARRRRLQRRGRRRRPRLPRVATRRLARRLRAPRPGDLARQLRRWRPRRRPRPAFPSPVRSPCSSLRRPESPCAADAAASWLLCS